MTTNQNHESVHSSLTDILDDIKQHLGIVLVAESGHGKSFTAFSLVKEAMQDPNLTVIVMSPVVYGDVIMEPLNALESAQTRLTP